jgi:hypothetical protein
MAKRKREQLNGVADLYLVRQLAEKHQAPDDDAFRSSYPKMFSILSDVRISEDQVIDPPILSVKNSCGDWSLSLSVPGLRMYGEVLASTFTEALALAEARLAAGDFPWKVNTKKKVVARKVKAEN